jgi:hypothetical protein
MDYDETLGMGMHSATNQLRLLRNEWNLTHGHDTEWAWQLAFSFFFLHGGMAGESFQQASRVQHGMHCMHACSTE